MARRPKQLNPILRVWPPPTAEVEEQFAGVEEPSRRDADCHSKAAKELGNPKESDCLRTRRTHSVYDIRWSGEALLLVQHLRQATNLKCFERAHTEDIANAMRPKALDTAGGPSRRKGKCASRKFRCIEERINSKHQSISHAPELKHRRIKEKNCCNGVVQTGNKRATTGGASQFPLWRAAQQKYTH